MRLKLLSVASATLLLLLLLFEIDVGELSGQRRPSRRSTRQYSRLTRAAGAAIGAYVYVKQKLRGLRRSFEPATEHREGLAATPKQ